jgi:uncharacterized protein YjgD (DUF1641 family)
VGKLTKEQVTLAKKEDVEDIFNRIGQRKKAQEVLAQERIMYELLESFHREISKQHLTNYAFAKRSGLKTQVIDRIISGADNAEVKTLIKMAAGVGKKLILKLA